MIQFLKQFPKRLKSLAARIPKWLAPAIFGAVVSLVLKAYFRPSLSASVAYSEAVTVATPGKPTQFVATMVEMFPTGQARLVAPISITFNSEKDFKKIPDDSLRIVKILITNNGFATAKHIRAGIGLPRGWNVVVSPNADVTNEKTFQPREDYPGYRVIEISRLTVDEAVVVTVSGPCGCHASETPHASKDGKLFLPAEKHNGEYAPLLFLTDEDGSPITEPEISMKDELEQEHRYFPTASAGFWAPGLKVNDKAKPAIKPLEHYTMEVLAKDGRHMELTTDHPIKLD